MKVLGTTYDFAYPQGFADSHRFQSPRTFSVAELFCGCGRDNDATEEWTRRIRIGVLAGLTRWNAGKGGCLAPEQLADLSQPQFYFPSVQRGSIEGISFSSPSVQCGQSRLSVVGESDLRFHSDCLAAFVLRLFNPVHDTQ